MTGIPEGWQHAALGDVCRIVSGSTPKTAVGHYWGGDIIWVTPDDLSKDRAQVIHRGKRTLTTAGYESCSANLFPSGSVVVSSRAPIGYVAIAGADMCTNQGCKTAVPPDFIDSRYLYWFLVHAKPDLEARASGTTFKEISGKRFAETNFWWPPIEEQVRIVETLEDHLSRLDAASANLRASEARAEAWAQSSIDGIVWHQQDARTIAVADLLAEKMRNGHSARASTTGQGVRALTLTAVTRGSFTDAFTKIVAVEPERVQNLWLRDGDVLVQRSNTPDLVGTTAIYHGPPDWAIFPDLLIRLRANVSQVSPDYLAIVMKTERAHRLLRARAKGLAGSMPKIDQDAIGSLPVPVLDHRGQAEVVSRVTEVEEAKLQLILEMQTAHRRAVALRKALLGAAFSGRLAAGGRELDHAKELAGV